MWNYNRNKNNGKNFSKTLTMPFFIINDGESRGNFYSSICSKLPLWVLGTSEWGEKAWVVVSGGLSGMGSGKHRLKYLDFQGLNKDSNNTHWAHTREQSANLSSAIQRPHAIGLLLAFFFQRRLAHRSYRTCKKEEQGDATCWACPTPWPDSEPLPGTDPYFGGNNVGDHTLVSIYIWT